MKISRAALALVFMAAMSLVASDVMAQRGGGGRRGGPGGGAGGMRAGGGMMGRGGGGGGSILGLLAVEKVQEELELMPDQIDAIKKLSSDRPQFERPEGFDPRDRSEENRAKMTEMMEKMRAQREEFEAKQTEKLDEVLFPEQMERLQQIQVQVMGVQALSNERVAKELKITTEQKEKLTEMGRTMREEMMAKVREMFSGGGGGDVREKIEELRKGAEEKVLDVLTPDQKKSFEEMKGEPFEMPQMRGRGGPGGDRGGRGGERGGRPDGDRGGRPDRDRGGRPGADF
ncbi:MAG: hypothetical protein AAFV88_05525 [Planctomycetota bacterium]